MKSFNDIIGYEAVKKELYQVIDMFKNKELYEKMGARLPKGILLYGGPGLGKTMLCEAMINECGEQAYVLKKNDVKNKIIDKINQIFTEAEKLDNKIIFIDDIDKFSDSTEDETDDETFSAIQAGIDLVRNKNVLILATANRYNKLPTSLVRSGRFDIKMCLKSPNNEDGAKIIEYYLKSKNVDANLNYEDVSKMISYSSCSDLEKVINRSAVFAAYQRKDKIDIEDIVKAYINFEGEYEDAEYKCDDQYMNTVVLHEAGHAVVAEVLKEGSVGFICASPLDNYIRGFMHLYEKSSIRSDHVLIALAGKAAIELYLQGKCASGCEYDLDVASNLIKDGISDSGICGIGMLDINKKDSVLSDILSSKNAVIHAEIERYMFITKDILIKNKEFLMSIVEKLKEKHYLLYSDINEIKKSVNIIRTEYNI